MLYKVCHNNHIRLCTFINEKRQIYTALSKLENIKHICEIGFNAGHSALLWLHSNQNAKVTML